MKHLFGICSDNNNFKIHNFTLNAFKQGPQTLLPKKLLNSVNKFVPGDSCSRNSDHMKYRINHNKKKIAKNKYCLLEMIQNCPFCIN